MFQNYGCDVRKRQESLEKATGIVGDGKGRASEENRNQRKMIETLLAGQGPAVLAAGAGWVVYIFFFIFHLSSISNVLSFGRRLNMTEIL